jgi:hypothetical protein
VSNVIDFLERLGQDAQLRDATGEEIEVALLNAGIEPDLRAAILEGDQRALEALLGADSNVCCVVYKEDEEEEEEEHEGEEEEEEEGEDDEKSLLDGAQPSQRRVARTG